MELSIGSLIKIIIGILVIAAVAYGLYRFFGDTIISSFSGIELNGTIDSFLALL